MVSSLSTNFNVKYFFMKLVYFLGLILSIGNATAQSGNNIKTDASGNTLLWEISGNGLAAPSYLFGTFHLLCKDDINFSDT